MARRKRKGGTAESLPLEARHLKGNAILTGLGKAEVEKILAEGSLVNMPVRTQIYGIEEHIDEVYFPTTCVLSVVTQMEDGGQIEVGTIGREGTTAIPLVLGAKTSANHCYCQVPGQTICIPAELFTTLVGDLKFRELLNRYVQAYVNMLGQLAACNRLHNVYERCARWLLMTQDRADSENFELTHEYLAMMLGTQRSGVTIAAGTLQQAGFIKYDHGSVTIVDRDGLINDSCECYQVAREQFGSFLDLVDGNKKQI